MKSSALIIITVLLLCGCEWFGADEKHKTESDRTTYRSAQENPTDEVRPLPQHIPGESRR